MNNSPDDFILSVKKIEKNFIEGTSLRPFVFSLDSHIHEKIGPNENLKDDTRKHATK